MKKTFSIVFVVAITAYVAIHLIDYFFPHESLAFSMAIIGCVALLSTFLYTNLKTMLLPFFLMLSAIIVLTIHSSETVFYELEQGFRQMRSLTALLFLVPFVSWVLRYEPYIENVMAFFRKQLHSSKRFFFGLSAVVQMITYFLLVGTVPVMYHILQTMLKERTGELWESFKASIIIRSFALGTLWVLSMPSFSYAVQSTGSSLPLAIIQGFLFSLFAIVLSIIFLHFQEKRSNVSLTSGIQEEINRVFKDGDTNQREVNKKFIEFIILFSSLLGSVIILYLLFNMEILVAISVTIIVWTLFYFIAKRDLYRFFKECKFYFVRGVPLKAKELSMIISAGLLIHALNTSGWGRVFVEWVYQLSEKAAWMNFLTVLPFIVIFLGLIGLSPLTVIVLIGEIIQNIHLPYPPELVLLSLTLGSSLAMMLSPLGLPIIVLSNENKRSTVANSIKVNWFYALSFYIIVQLYIQLQIM